MITTLGRVIQGRMACKIRGGGDEAIWLHDRAASASALPSLGRYRTPGLVRESLLVPIMLPDENLVKVEAMVIRPDRPDRLPLVLLVHGTIVYGESERNQDASQDGAG